MARELAAGSRMPAINEASNSASHFGSLGIPTQ
jgi:hypothetical protein